MLRQKLQDQVGQIQGLGKCMRIRNNWGQIELPPIWDLRQVTQVPLAAAIHRPNKDDGAPCF